MFKPIFTRFLLCCLAVIVYTPKVQSQDIINPGPEDVTIDINDDPADASDEDWVRLISLVERLYTTAGDPFAPIYLVNPGEGFDGVGNIFLTTNTQIEDRCGASLLYSGQHLITAAHCLTNSQGVVNVTDLEVKFDLLSGTITEDIPPSNITIVPGWDGNITNGSDLAIITLENQAPPEIERYNIYRQSNEIGSIGTKVGYGRSGNGAVGDILDVGTKRAGRNLYDADGSLRSVYFGGATTGILGYDFDNGQTENDAFGFFFDIPNLGLGNVEVAGAPGDSGSPTFINGQIAGLTSFRETIFAVDEDNIIESSDVDFQLNSSFGEFTYDTRVSVYADWIDQEIGIVPEPTSILGSLLIGLGFIKSSVIRSNKKV